MPNNVNVGRRIEKFSVPVIYGVAATRGPSTAGVAEDVLVRSGDGLQLLSLAPLPQVPFLSSPSLSHT